MVVMTGQGGVGLGVMTGGVGLGVGFVLLGLCFHLAHPLAFLSRHPPQSCTLTSRLAGVADNASIAGVFHFFLLLGAP